jgi:hypothetical protein
MFKNGDTSWKKIVEVPDELKNGVIELARRQFADYANGMSAPGGSNEYSDLLREYRLSLPENERASAMWTLIFEKEEDAV